MKYEKFKKSDFNEWLKLCLALWPSHEEDKLSMELKGIEKSKKQETFFALDDGEYIGFINVSLRYEYVESTDTSPVGYVEGIYTKPDYRKQGVAKKLLELAEGWIKEKGCTEIASCTWVENNESKEFHKSIGFKEMDTIVHYVKKLV